MDLSAEKRLTDLQTSGIERMKSLLQGQAPHFDLGNVVRSDALGGEQRQVIVTHEGELVMIGGWIITHRGGADRVRADSVAPRQDQLGLNGLDSLNPRPLAASIGFDSVHQT